MRGDDLTPTVLDRVFNARAIAVIGASNDPRKRGFQTIRRLLADGYGGTIHPIHPKAPEILGLPASPSVADVTGDIDLALICTPAATVPGILAECGAKGIPGAVVLAAGFGEIGAAGAEIDATTRQAAAAHGVRLIGPNTNGLFNLHNAMNLVGVDGATPGGIAVCSQSGNMLLSLVSEARRRGGIGFSSYAGVGNQMDVHLAEYLDHFGRDPATRAAVFYVEGFQKGRAFLDTCRHVAQAKPVVICKSGRTAAGQAAAKSHTGALASGFALTQGLLRQAGATVVDSPDDLLPIAHALAHLPLPMGSRVAILADGGGHATVAVDALVEAGVDLATLSGATRARLADLLPAAASCVNPVDVAGGTDADPGLFADCAQAILQDAGVDVLLTVGMFGGYAERFDASLGAAEQAAAQRLAEIAADAGKPLIVHSVYAGLGTAPLAALAAAQVPVFPGMALSVRTVAELVRRGQAVRRLAAAPAATRPLAPDPARAIVAGARAAGRTALYEPEARDLLAAHGLPLSPHVVTRAGEDLDAAMRRLGDGPLVAKVVSPDILHKSDAGGVKLNLSGAAAVRDAIAEIYANANAYDPNAHLHGVMLAPMAAPGVEAILGVVQDPAFGPVMMFGLGGIFVEVLQDVAFRALPLSAEDANEMIAEIGAARILEGVRGAAPVDRAALVELMLTLSRIALAHPEIGEIDLNPVILRADGHDIADARMILRPEGDNT
ncbi:acetate--CoA ligase family protein [Rhodovulum adriaticum]|uniref:Acetyltransferase n=1 Tax=Rhodovulum adriaticum TaxID=35804 RepID=A0A4R2NI69_RHOAD|nr:acetate--CoA ligase [Rhodovulum adriaticum]MBK1635385.1 acetyl-CoA synthetase [Rhodovulum adriaticum]TCP21091.1 acetyltransferase [Rhodovulum adriaticum]